MTPSEMIVAGYCVISRRHRLVARIDTPDWRERLASTHPDGMNWVRRLGTLGAADHYRRCYSNDRRTIAEDEVSLIPNSNGGPGIFVPMPNVVRMRHRRATEPSWPPSYVAEADEFPTIDESPYPEPLPIGAPAPLPPPRKPALRTRWRRFANRLRLLMHVHAAPTSGPLLLLEEDVRIQTLDGIMQHVGYLCVDCGEYVPLGVYRIKDPRE